MKRVFDVAVVGAGPAGLSAALVLARARRSVAVLDAGSPRNAASPGVHGFLSRDGVAPAELKAVSRAQIARYGTVEFSTRRVKRILPVFNPTRFALFAGEDRPIRARYVLLSMGMLDRFPRIGGFREHWGRNVIHCQFCHGWENAGRRWGVFVDSEQAFDGVRGLCNWTDDILVFANPDIRLSRAVREAFDRLGIRVERRRVRRLLSSADGDLSAAELEDGARIPLGTLLWQPRQRQTDLVLRSGLRLDGDGRVLVDESNESSIRGIFAGGDLTAGPQDALSAAATGAAIGRHLSAMLAQDRDAVSRPVSGHATASGEPVIAASGLGWPAAVRTPQSPLRGPG